MDSVKDMVDVASMRWVIFEDIEKERDHQEQKYGTDFDSRNTANDWAAYVCKYVGDVVLMGGTPEDIRKCFLKAASVCVAAMENFDARGSFPPRHYDYPKK
jgi:hypothetical protein